MERGDGCCIVQIKNTMKRVAFTIIYNGHHHLKHNDQWKFIVENFDHWIVVEGAAKNGGSTAWCKEHPGASNSTDGTIWLMTQIAHDYPQKVSFIVGNGFWNSKDEMCNAALDKAAQLFDDEFVYLWEIDADEQWTLDALIENEKALAESGKLTGAIRWNHFVSHDLIAVGDWGGNLNTRLWIWCPKQQRFITHEPPNMSDGGTAIELPRKCNHYGYLFERDVYFKSQYYGGHENVYDGWLKLQVQKERDKLKFPLHISFLFGNNNWIGKSNSHIINVQ